MKKYLYTDNLLAASSSVKASSRSLEVKLLSTHKSDVVLVVLTTTVSGLR